MSRRLSAIGRRGSVALSLPVMIASLASAWAVGGCCRRIPAMPPPGASDGSAWRTMIDRCEPGEPVTCPADVFARGVAACIDDWEAARVGEVELRRCRELAGVDRAEMQGTVDILRDTVERLRGQRWIWGAVGVAIGALAAATAISVAGH